MTTTATARAAEINAETRARAAAEGWAGFGTLVEDPAYWASAGIVTGDDLDRYLAHCDYVDTYKDAHGIKPRWTSWRDATAAEWAARTADLVEAEARAAAEEARREAVAAAKVAAATTPTPLTHNPFAALRGRE